MKKIPQSEKFTNRNSVAFRSSTSSILKNQLSDQSEVFIGRKKRNPFTSLVRFKKLEVCSEQSQSSASTHKQEVTDNKINAQPNEDEVFLRRNSKKALTDYFTQRSFQYRSEDKKKTMIPVKNCLEKKLSSEKSFMTKRATKSFSKVAQEQKPIQDLSLKSLNHKYSKLKRQASSLWSIPTKNFIKHEPIQSPTKFLLKEERQLMFLSKQYQRVLHLYQQQQQKKIVLNKLIISIKTQQFNETVQTKKQKSSKHDANYNQQFLLTQAPFNDFDMSARSAYGSTFLNHSTNDSMESSQFQNLIRLIHNQINKFRKEQNILKAKLIQMIEEILFIRKERVIYSSVFKNIEQEIKSEQMNFLSILAQNRKVLGLTVDVEIGSNLQKLKTIMLKKYHDFETNGLCNILPSNLNDNLMESKENGIYKLKKQQSGIQENINIIRNYNSISCAHIFFPENQSQKLKNFRENSFKCLIKPRKQISSRLAEQKSQAEAEAQICYKIEEYRQLLQKMAMELQIGTKNQVKNTANNSKDKSIEALCPYRILSSDLFNHHNNNTQIYRNDKSYSPSISKSIKFKQLKLKFKQQNSKRRNDEHAINQLSLKSSRQLTVHNIEQAQQSISSLIAELNSTIIQKNLSYETSIRQKDNLIFQVQDLIDSEKQVEKSRLNRIKYVSIELNQKLGEQQVQQNSQSNKEMEKIYHDILNLCLGNITTAFSPSIANQNSDNGIYEFINNLQMFYDQTVLRTFQSSVKDSKQNILQSLQPKAQKKLNQVNQTPFDLRLGLFCYFKEPEQPLKTKQAKQNQGSIKKEAQSQQSQKPSSLFSSNVFQYNNHLYKSNIPPPQGQVIKERRSKGLSTLMMNMEICESYEKAFSRQQFENEYKKQLLNGRKKKKTLLKRTICYVNNIN